jgi:exopolyphosphatase/guanosine-5'-triphosphate,3'-diphosphate pyrophosphatase
LVQRETGFQVRILSGHEEAKCTFFGAVHALQQVPTSSFDDHNKDHLNVVIDIGGGSTEVAVGSDVELINSHSYDMGSVRFSERYLHTPNKSYFDSIPTETQIDTCRQVIRQVFATYRFPEISHSKETQKSIRVIGVAGLFQCLASIEKNFTTWSPKINGHIITIESLSRHMERFSKMTPNEMLKLYPTILMGRADIFVCGLLILDEFMKEYQFDSITVSTGGIRLGALLLDFGLSSNLQSL